MIQKIDKRYIPSCARRPLQNFMQQSYLRGKLGKDAVLNIFIFSP